MWPHVGRMSQATIDCPPRIEGMKLKPKDMSCQGHLINVDSIREDSCVRMCSLTWSLPSNYYQYETDYALIAGLLHHLTSFTLSQQVRNEKSGNPFK